MKIVLLGGNGFVGSAYTRLLRQTDVQLIVAGRDNYTDYIGASCDVLINANGNSKEIPRHGKPKRGFSGECCECSQ